MMNAHDDTPFAMIARSAEQVACARVRTGVSNATTRYSLDLSDRATGHAGAPVTRCRCR